MIVKSKTTTEKRPMIDVRATQDAFENNEIPDSGWIRSDEILVSPWTD